MAALAGPTSAQPAEDPPALALPPAAAQPIATPPGVCAPEKLFRTVVRNISPGLPASASAAQPRRLWRQGAHFLRSEEDIDPVRGDQRVVVVAEPDVWVVNLADRTARHSIDPGPELVVRAPILPLGSPPELMKLEFGCEREFLAEFAPVPEREVPWGAARAALHRVTVGEHSVALLMDAKRDSPLLVSYLRQGRPIVVYRYDEYRHGLPARPQLFAPGRNIRIIEAPRATSPTPGEFGNDVLEPE
ncbi:MAG: hypothetical protein ACOY5Y_01650 [Pseudomonadota bacterium]